MLDNTEQITVPYVPLPWQAEVHALLAKHRFLALVAARRSGKSWLSCATLIYAALATPRSRFAYVSPTRAMSRTLVWDLMKQLCADIPGVTFQESQLRVVFPNNSDILLLGAETADTQGRGLELSGLILDEASFVKIDDFYSVFRPALASTQGFCLIAGTPQSPADLLGHAFHYAKRSGDPDWAAYQIDAYEAGNLDPAEIAAMIKQSPSEGTTAREVFARVDVTADNIFIPQQDVQAAMDRTAPQRLEQALAGQEKVISIDCAGDGSDKTVIARRWGSVMLPFIELDGGVEGNQIASARLVDEIRTFRPDGIFVDGGGGFHAGLFATVRDALGYPLIAINFGSKALKDDLYFNRRAEMYGGLRDWLRRPDSVLTKDHETLVDFTATRFTLDPRGRIKLEPKQDVKARISKSPDRADAAALSFALPVMPAGQTYDPGRRPTFERGSDGSKYYSGRSAKRQPRNGYSDFDPHAGLED